MNKSREVGGTWSRRLGGEVFDGFPVYSDAKGYKLIFVNGKNIKIHVFVWERINGKKPLGYDIHHIDFDKGNYSPENLQLLSKSDHQKLHAGWIKTNGEWTHKPCTKCLSILPLLSFYPRKGYTPSAQCKPCHIKTTDEWARNNAEKSKEIKRNWYNKNKQGGKKHA